MTAKKPTTTRVTIVLDNDVKKALRDIQAKRIRESNESISFSRVVNDKLRISVKL